MFVVGTRLDRGRPAVLRACHVPAPCLFLALLLVCVCALGLECEGVAKPFGHAAHQVRYLAVRFHGLALEPVAGLGPFPLEHRPKVQKFKKERGHNANCPEASRPGR